MAGAGMPEWCSQLRHLLLGLDRTRVDRLEAFRLEIDCPDEAFALLIAGSKWATRQSLGQTWNLLMIENPKASPRELVSRIYEQRRTLASTTGQVYPPLPASCQSLEQLMDFVATYEGQFAGPDPHGWGKRVEQLLRP